MKRLANIVGGWVEMQNLRDRGKEDNKNREMTQIKVKQIAGSSSNYKMLGVLKSNLSYVVGKRMHYTAFLCFLPNLGVTNIFFFSLKENWLLLMCPAQTLAYQERKEHCTPSPSPEPTGMLNKAKTQKRCSK